MATKPDHAGRMFARCAKALFMGGDSVGAAIAYAHSQNWNDTHQLETHLKTVLTGMSLVDMPATAAGLDFAAAVRPRTVWGQLPGVRRVPLSVRMLTVTTGSAATFVGEGRPIPVSHLDIAGDTLPPLKVAALVVIAQEALRSSAPAAEDGLREDLIAACVQGLDRAFLDPANVGAPGVAPAAITAGIPQRVSTGSTVAAIEADLGAMADDLVAAGSTLESAAWVIRPATLARMCRMRDTSGALAFPGLSVLGGQLLGLPVIAGGNAPPAGSPPAAFIFLIDGAQVTIGDDGQAEIALSNAAALQLEDAPTNATATGTATTMTSLYQINAVAFRPTLWTNWKLRRPWVSVLSGVTY